MDPERKVIELLKNLSKKGDCFFYATVTAVQELTCSVIIADLELTDVRLKATTLEDEDKLVITPFKGSKVIVGSNNGDLRDLMILKVDDPEKIFYKHKDITIDIDGSSGNIVINKGDNGGLINIENLVERLNAIEDYVKEFRIKYDAHNHPTAPTGPVSPPSMLIITDPEKSQRDPLEDKKVKH